MRRLARVPDDVEDLGLRQAEDRKPVEPGPPRAGVAVAAFPAELARAGRTLFRAHAHGVHQPPAELGMGFQITAQLALDGSALLRGRAIPRCRGRPHAPLLDVFEQGLAGGDGS